jgi:hypothetical protein
MVTVPDWLIALALIASTVVIIVDILADRRS